jgi:phosphoglycerate dehydrogenase-like enzyme
LAVIGYGRIGRRLAELATAFGMRVIAHDPYAATADIALTGLHGALSQADVVSLHAPLTPETRGMIDETALEHIKPGAVLVNCGRGGTARPRCRVRGTARRSPRRHRTRRVRARAARRPFPSSTTATSC